MEPITSLDTIVVPIPANNPDSGTTWQLLGERTEPQADERPRDVDSQDGVDDFDGDSALGDESGSETRSLTQSILDYEYENGRRYHAYQAGSYPMPNDTEEQARMDMQHHIYLMLFNGELYKAPLPTHIHRALDIGCGTGKWALDFADSRPNTQVIGKSAIAMRRGAAEV